MSDSELILTARADLDGFSLDLDERISLQGVTAVFGASGSGKTSLLNTIAGFIRPESGQIVFGSETWFQAAPKVWIPPHKRAVGSVFQDTRLFPHLSVRGNLDYAKARALPEAPGYSFDDIISAMDISSLLDRQSQTLSGGEKQRVAIARTLLTRPALLLLDEPLAALDDARKGDLLPFLETLKTQFAIPTLYVSHDVDEVSRIADHVLMMEAGRVVATGQTEDVLARFGLEAGRNPYEQASLLRGRVDRGHEENNLVSVRIGEVAIWLASDLDLPQDSDVALKIPSRDVSIALQRPEGISIQNMLPAIITALEPTRRRAFQTVVMSVDGQRLEAIVTHKAMTELGLSVGQSVFALIKSATFHH